MIWRLINLLIISNSFTLLRTVVNPEPIMAEGHEYTPVLIHNKRQFRVNPHRLLGRQPGGKNL